MSLCYQLVGKVTKFFGKPLHRTNQKSPAFLNTFMKNTRNLIIAQMLFS